MILLPRVLGCEPEYFGFVSVNSHSWGFFLCEFGLWLWAWNCLIFMSETLESPNWGCSSSDLHLFLPGPRAALHLWVVRLAGIPSSSFPKQQVQGSGFYYGVVLPLALMSAIPDTFEAHGSLLWFQLKDRQKTKTKTKNLSLEISLAS